MTKKHTQMALNERIRAKENILVSMFSTLSIILMLQYW